MTRQQALTAATIVVAGSTGDSLGAERLSDVFGLACEYARGEHDSSAMDDMATWAHPLGWGRINMGDTSLAADGLCLAARASRTPEEHATVLSIAGQIVRGHPAEIVLNGVGHALADSRQAQCHGRQGHHRYGIGPQASRLPWPEAGVVAAVAEAQTLLAIPGVTGVNLSGLASGRGYDYAAQVKADCATRIREVRAT